MTNAGAVPFVCNTIDIYLHLVYHGIGTGKLAYAVRTFLSTYPALASYGDAPINQGGYGATLIKL